jgi:hypothetical protein
MVGRIWNVTDAAKRYLLSASAPEKNRNRFNFTATSNYENKDLLS